MADDGSVLTASRRAPRRWLRRWTDCRKRQPETLGTTGLTTSTPNVLLLHARLTPDDVDCTTLCLTKSSNGQRTMIWSGLCLHSCRRTSAGHFWSILAPFCSAWLPEQTCRRIQRGSPLGSFNFNVRPLSIRQQLAIVLTQNWSKPSTLWRHWPDTDLNVNLNSWTESLKSNWNVIKCFL